MARRCHRSDGKGPNYWSQSSLLEGLFPTPGPPGPSTTPDASPDNCETVLPCAKPHQHHDLWRYPPRQMRWLQTRGEAPIPDSWRLPRCRTGSAPRRSNRRIPSTDCQPTEQEADPVSSHRKERRRPPFWRPELQARLPLSRKPDVANRAQSCNPGSGSEPL